jgi:uncharacterized membrane protein YhiD involved in acid resistance
MPEWLTQTLGSDLKLSVWELALRLILALACGCVIAGVYRLSRRREVVTRTFPPTLVLLTILCAMLPQVIGENVAWAFGLVGALSIVRFRTVVEDTLDITFVIFAVLVGMAVGAGHLTVALVGIGVVGGAALMLQPRRPASRWTDADGSLTVRVGVGRDPDAILLHVFDKHLERYELLAGATGRQGTAIDLTYKVRLRADSAPADLIGELNQIDGVQSVELRIV